MKKNCIFLVLILFFCCITKSSYASLQDPRLFVPGEIIISFEPSITESNVEDLASQLNFSVVRKLRLRQRNKYLVKVGDDQSEEDLISQLIQNDDVLRAKRNGIVRIPETWPPFPEIIYPIPDGDQIDFEDLPDIECTREDLFWQWYRRPEDILELIRVRIGPTGEYEPCDEGFGFGNGITFVNRAFLEFPSYVDAFPFIDELSSVNVVPEPATISLLGLGGLAFLRNRRR